MNLRKSALSSLVAVALSCVPLRAQVAAAAAAGATAAAPHLVAAAPAVLTGAVSSGSAHVGQAVLAKLASPAALSNGAKLPAGSQLLGKVTQVQSLSGGNGTSKLSMLFDRVRMPDGNEQPMTGSMLRSIGSSSARASAQQQEEGSAQQPQQRQQPNVANPAGGLLGGVTDAVGSSVNSVTNTTGSLLGSVTGLPGVLLDNSGTLAAQGRNVTVPANTRISVQASAQAQ